MKEPLSTDQQGNYGMGYVVPVCAHVSRRPGGDLTISIDAYLEPCPWCELDRLLGVLREIAVGMTPEDDLHGVPSGMLCAARLSAIARKALRGP